MLRAVVAIGATAQWVATDDASAGMPPAAAAQLIENLRTRFLPFMIEAAPATFFTDDDRQTARDAQREFLEFASRDADPDGAVTILERIYASDLRPLLPNIVAPVLLVHGGNDLLTPPAAAELMRELIPVAQIDVISGAGHLPMLTNPDAVAASIRRFLEARSD